MKNQSEARRIRVPSHANFVVRGQSFLGGRIEFMIETLRECYTCTFLQSAPP